MEVQWYPGHMTKARRMMEENIRLVDLVIELVDARIPVSSRNPDIQALCRGKGRVVLLCKADLADPEKTQKFVERFRDEGILAVAVDAREKKAADAVRRLVQEACQEKLARDRARGIVGRPLRAMVAGIPNVGKSTFINSFAGRASAKTGNKPGVTRGRQWIRLGGNVELLDTPGILWPKFEDPETGIRLALVGAVRDEILDKEKLAVWLLGFLGREYPGIIREKYLKDSGDAETDGVDAENIAGAAESGDADGACADIAGEACSGDDDGAGADTEGETCSGDDDGADAARGWALLSQIAGARRLLLKGGEPDTLRAASMLVDDCKNGRIGRISLDRPGDAAVFGQKEGNGGQNGKQAANDSRNRGGRQSAAGGRSGKAVSPDRSRSGNKGSAAGFRPGGKASAAREKRKNEKRGRR